MYRVLLVAVASMFVAWHSVAADDHYLRIPLEALELVEGKLPDAYRDQLWIQRTLPRVVLDGTGEAYLLTDRENAYQNLSLTLRTTEPSGEAPKQAAGDRAIEGSLYIAGTKGLESRVRFRIPTSKASDDAPAAFLKAKQEHYQALLARPVAGSAWFRHQANLTAKAAGGVAQEQIELGARDLSSTYTLFTGGRAISENLQLDRVLVARPAADEKPVELGSIEGITVAEIDWKPLIEGIDPTLDPLASAVPADQHVIFFPAFDVMLQFIDQGREIGGVLPSLLNPTRSEDDSVFQRYQHQLGLTTTGLSQVLGPKVIRSVAVTGSDPYFSAGTDVAVLFEAAKPEQLEALLLSQITSKLQDQPGVEAVSGSAGKVKYRSLQSKDRTVSSYVARLNNAVVVTNSPYQLERLASVQAAASPSIASLDEFKFFRNRYPIEKGFETAFVFLSDATIRRWCSPRWRIGDSRRVRAAAIMADFQAGAMIDRANGTSEAGPIVTDRTLTAEEKLRLSDDDAQSSAFGSLQFMTPIAELELESVSKGEADAYGRWRDGYQRNWSWAFDPIALRLHLTQSSLSADLTVMPLIAGSEYRRMIDVAKGSEITPEAGDPHDAMGHFVLAIDKKAKFFETNVNAVAGMFPTLKASPFTWLGKSVAVYWDDDPFWEKWLSADEQEASLLLQAPIGLHAEVSNTLQLAGFLTGLRGIVEQSAPGLTEWESLKHNEQAYVKVTAKGANLGQSEDVSLYYSPSPYGLVVTLNEALLKRALDRRAARSVKKAKPEAAAAADSRSSADSAPTLPWLGKHVVAQLRGVGPTLAALPSQSSYQSMMQTVSWNNLPILNEWRRLFPKEDPVAIHEKYWNVKLVCPAGGTYVWNEKWQTMESTALGHPGEPRRTDRLPGILQTLNTANFGLTFEDNGLQAKVVLQHATESLKPQGPAKGGSKTSGTKSSTD